MKFYFKIVFVVLLFFFVFVNYFFNNKYNSNYYDVLVNDEKVVFYLKEQYTKKWIPLIRYTVNSKRKWINQDEDKQLNTVKLSDSINLNLVKYNCYNQDNKEKIDCLSNDNYINKKIVNQEIYYTIMTIERNSENLYTGQYISDISDYIKEPGRYYFKIVIKNNYFFSKITSRIIFNIKFIGE